MEALYWYVGVAIYVALALIAVWGALCLVLVWRRVAQARFRSEDEQDAFLDRVDEAVEGGNLQAAVELCDGDERAMSQLVLLAIANRRLGYAKIRTMGADRFQRDGVSDRGDRFVRGH